MSAHINNKIFCDSINAITEVLNVIAVDKSLAKHLCVPIECAELLATMKSASLSKVASKYVKSLARATNIFKVDRDVLCDEVDELSVNSSIGHDRPFNSTQKNRLRSISVNTITSLVSTILEESEEQGTKLFNFFGFSQSDIHQLEKLQRHQVQQLAEQYLYSVGLYDLFVIEAEVLRNCIESVHRDIREKALIESFIENKACNKTLMELFGIRSTSIAGFRKKLNCPVSTGRSLEVRQEYDDKIFQSWKKFWAVADERERYLQVAIDLGIGVSEVFRSKSLFATEELQSLSA